MKITQLKSYIANNPGRGYVFVKIETDEGIHGWGEGTLEAKERAVVAAITDLSGHIVGQDPTRVEYQKLLQVHESDEPQKTSLRGPAHEPG